jgi:hypothetical protein
MCQVKRGFLGRLLEEGKFVCQLPAQFFRRLLSGRPGKVLRDAPPICKLLRPTTTEEERTREAHRGERSMTIDPGWRQKKNKKPDRAIAAMLHSFLTLLRIGTRQTRRSPKQTLKTKMLNSYF